MTVDKRLSGAPVTGAAKLTELLGHEVVARLRRWFGGAAEDDIDALNARHFIVGVGATTAVGDEYDGIPLIQTFEHFKRKYCKRTIPRMKKGKLITVPLADYWLQHERGRQYERLVFKPPPCPCDPRDYNLWHGLTTKPSEGDWSKMAEHIRQVICSGSDAYSEYLLNWMAMSVQTPGVLPEVAVALRGGRGTGKSLFVRAFGELFGPHFLHLSSGEQLTGHFNAHLAAKVLVFADEAYWAGDKKAESSLKRLITEPSLLIERKGIDAHMENNFTHLILATNNDWSFPAGTDERRVFALQVSDERKQEHGYFGALVAELESGGREAMLHDLLERDLTGFNVRQVPATKELAEQKLQTLTPIELWWYGVLADGTIGGTWPTRVDRQTLLLLAQEALKKEGVAERSLRIKLGMALKRLLPGGAVGDRGVGGHYRLPPLATCRAHFCKVVADVTWDAEPELPLGEGVPF